MARLPLLLMLAVCTGPVCPQNPVVKCLIINLAYVNCNWDAHNVNYSFHSTFHSSVSLAECPVYLLEGKYSVGCKIPYSFGERFSKLRTKLIGNNAEVLEEHELKHKVKLYPPYNLSVEMGQNPEFWLYWNISSQATCTESEVRYRQDGGQWESSSPTQKTSYVIPFPSKEDKYEFQVKSRVSSLCGESEFWSEWSLPLFWGALRNNSNKESGRPHETQFNIVLYAVIGTISFILVVSLLLTYDRIKIILVPSVPNPGKNLEDLLYLYNGNVEEWLHISKEFVEGFKPNFSELACPVQEYQLCRQDSMSSSECSLPMMTLSTSDSASTSTFDTPTESFLPA